MTTAFYTTQIYSTIRASNFGSVFVSRDVMHNIERVRRVRTPGIFGTSLVITHRNAGEHVVKQQDRGQFWIEGKFYTGECNGFADAVRLINGM